MSTGFNKGHETGETSKRPKTKQLALNLFQNNVSSSLNPAICANSHCTVVKQLSERILFWDRVCGESRSKPKTK